MSEWISIKKEKPPYREFVEVYLGKDQSITVLGRDFAVLVRVDDEDSFNYGDEEWVMGGMYEKDWSPDGYGIKYWRYLDPDPLGMKQYAVETESYGLITEHRKAKK